MKNINNIEAAIDNRIAELSKEFDLDRYDIEQIRLEAYRENGWSYDPFREEEEEPETEWHYRSMSDQLEEVGMNLWDFI